ncbi:MAG: M50 family metallopeptidase, partial [Acidimicrobiales bacterium]
MSERRAILGLAAAVVLLVVGAYATNLVSALIAVAVIAGVIMLHEAGHFTAAKLSGMKVTEYFLGFGPKLWSIRRGETEYGVKALPLGGYVRIVGMHNLDQVELSDEPRTYRQQSFPRRLAVAVAGSTVHFVLAIVAAWSLFAFAHQATAKPVIANVPPLSGGVSPAERAGFDPGDEIVAFDGTPTGGRWNAVHTYIQHHIGKPITFDVLRHRGGAVQRVTLVATPADAATLTDHGQPMSTDHVGILGIDMVGANYSLAASIPHAFNTFWHAGVIDTFRGVGQIFSPHGLSSIGHQVVSSPGTTPADRNTVRPSSVVGIVQLAGQLHGWPEEAYLFLIANAFVGILNLFPILPFDGGHVVIAIYERVRSR